MRPILLDDSAFELIGDKAITSIRSDRWREPTRGVRVAVDRPFSLDYRGP